MYRIRIIDSNVDTPDDVFDKDYEDFDEACNNLCNFVHQFDGKEQVDGSVMDLDNEWEDIDFRSSVMNVGLTTSQRKKKPQMLTDCETETKPL